MKYKKYDQFVSGPWYFFIRKITKSNGMYQYHCETYKHDNRKQDRIFTEIGLDGLKPYKEKVVEDLMDIAEDK